MKLIFSERKFNPKKVRIEMNSGEKINSQRKEPASFSDQCGESGEFFLKISDELSGKFLSKICNSKR